MKKILFLVSFLFLVNVVNAETLNIYFDSKHDNKVVFDVVVKNVKNEKNNVVAGTIFYDAQAVSDFQLIPQNEWEIYTKQEGNKVNFIAFHMNKYVTEAINIFDVEAVVHNDDSIKNIDLILSNVESSSGTEIISLNDVFYQYNLDQKEQVQIPSKDDSNNSSTDNKENNKNDDSGTDNDGLTDDDEGNDENITDEGNKDDIINGDNENQSPSLDDENQVENDKPGKDDNEEDNIKIPESDLMNEINDPKEEQFYIINPIIIVLVCILFVVILLFSLKKIRR